MSFIVHHLILFYLITDQKRNIMTSKIEILECCFVATSALMPLLLTLDANFSVSKMICISGNDCFYNVTAYLNTKESEHLFIKFLNDNMIDHEITFFD